ncbi:Ssp120 protein [Pichia kluyveri]|uniref:Ssp120 protein n=1 Tax=Pichia kluyveri TaxID=36015 RepID=A0AAV5R3U4_PICKL|nr:Ssp120 protein [Pichia kluyveri]
MKGLYSIIALLSVVLAHGSHEETYNKDREYNEPIPEEYNGSWEQWHMAHEHQLDDYTPDAFFQIHAVTDPKYLMTNDILRMYGLQRDEVVGQGDGMGNHDNSELVSPELKNKVIDKILGMIDTDHDGKISMEEYLEYATNGGQFPDFGIGPGHEYDFEEEYEKHHWNEFHANDDPDVKIIHKEDIEHELLHHFHEIDHDDEDAHENPNAPKHNVRKPILVKNIPPSFQF